MKTLALLSILCFGLMTDIVQAQEPPIIRKLLLVHDCAHVSIVLPRLQEVYQEEPFAMGRAAVVLPQTNQIVDGILLMHVNRETFSYTISILFEDDMLCMLTAGDEFRPAFGEPKTQL